MEDPSRSVSCRLFSVIPPPSMVGFHPMEKFHPARSVSLEAMANDCHRKRKTWHAHFIPAGSWKSNLGRGRLIGLSYRRRHPGAADSPLTAESFPGNFNLTTRLNTPYRYETLAHGRTNFKRRRLEYPSKKQRAEETRLGELWEWRQTILNGVQLVRSGWSKFRARS